MAQPQDSGGIRQIEMPADAREIGPPGRSMAMPALIMREDYSL
jgi:hypothetical protein